MSDWIKHDGATPVYQQPDGTVITLKFAGDGLRPSGTISRQWPGWYWRLKDVRVGWFRTERRPVCDDPAYAPIIAYCFEDEGEAEATSEGFEMLRRIVSDPASEVGEKINMPKPERVPG